MPKNFELGKYKNKKFIFKEDLENDIKKQYGYKKDSSVRWKIHELEKSKTITKINNTHFYNGYLKPFEPALESKELMNIKKTLTEKYSSLEIVVFESSLLNEWINHQVSKNIIFVQVEKYYTENIFNYLKENTNVKILFEPSKDDFYRYAENNTVVVTSIVTRSPRNLKNYTIKLEKLIVDIFSSDLIQEFISSSEFDSLIETLFTKYKINIKTTLSYAKRRLLDDRVYKYIEDYIPKGAKDDR
ncbi:MAG TPA: hypothetical protein GX012_02045 [Acholeplasma sp.]|nr:hypothetical protein [Acholeplasma sp.]